MNLKNKRILITAGPTWVKIDSVRVINNTASGLTGILLAEKLNRLGAKVTLLLGPVALAVDTCCLNNKIRLIRFRFFDELRLILKRELALKRYAVVIHTAAVSDYKPALICQGKIRSGLKALSIKLRPTPKIINVFKEAQPDIFLVGFKFEPKASKINLIKEARRLIKNTHSDLIAANTLKNNHYLAYLVSPDKIRGPMRSKKNMAESLIKILRCTYARA
ncbi:MAG: hypothetical protein COT38_05905 [Candidatus Omnitrophica bacterium CG08_land_8_20_14_0_20_41_16]|uniref:DNA/pantothenate metabolism flavoprotein C-terminal domain-containing protein n=1 Tax=Candidatus Sherwoodlollariibacterium unditelluris TaxID=1974757 RepID=A0A2G9YIU3_9BACT|nr:MAG: hypothetical protein COX41_04410 [Candidatus Omnitrophica bacterium CG23_combo_of_CG06-09_8_20_14_all_41_10]PIS33328.1 MAG: hypothetical protein COT38_05905 [Candidatus Omnitrophica bacterium CG08_land_8_20_14_0_20_41_16]